MRITGQKSKTGDKSGKVLFGYFISYIVIITVLFVAIGGYSYVNIVRINRERTISELQFNMRKYMDTLDGNLRGAMDVTMSFYNNREISRLRKLPEQFAPREYVMFGALSRTLSPYANTFVERVTLYFHSSQLFIASDMVESRPLIYYNLESLGSASDYDTWRLEQIEQTPGRFYVPDTSSGRSVNLYYMLPFGDKNTGVTVITTLQIASMLESFGFADRYQRAAVFLTDDEGKILYAGGNMSDSLGNIADMDSPATTLKAEGVRYQWYTEKSPLTNWSLHFLIDERELYASGIDMQKSLISVYFSVLTISLLLAVLFAKSTSDPVESILRLIDGQGKETSGTSRKQSKIWRFMNGNRLRYVWQRVSDISESNTTLIRKVRDYRDTSRDVFFHKLLSGDAILPEEVIMGQERGTKLFGYTSFTVAVANFIFPLGEDSIGNRDGALSAATSLLDYLNATERDGVYAHKLEDSRIAVILCSDRVQSREELIAPLSDIPPQAVTHTGVSIYWGIGSTVYNLDQVFVSCQNAVQVLCSVDVQENGAYVWYDGNKSKPGKLSYRAEDEQRLINAMSQGDAETAKKIVSEIKERNSALLDSFEAQRSQFVAAFTETFYRMENLFADIEEECEKELRLYLWQMKNMRESHLIMNYLYMIIDFFCDVVSKRNANRNQKLMKGICDYIDESFGDPNLCLSTIASHFCLTENYISTFFKQNGGINISQHIEKVRMLRAAKLLKDTKLGATVIAEQIGYGNINTFYKAFKRYYGVNPKVFRSGGKEQA